MLPILEFNADAVVPNRKQPIRSLSPGLDMDLRWINSPVANRISNQVLEKLFQLEVVDAGQ